MYPLKMQVNMKKFSAFIFAAAVLLLGFVPACRPKAKYGGPPDTYKRIQQMEDSIKKADSIRK